MAFICKLIAMFNLFRTNRHGQVLSHLNNLIAVALADGTLDRSEWKLLAAIAQARGVTEDELLDIKEEAETIKFIAPPTYREKIRQIYELVDVMKADGEIDEAEVQICRKLAEKLNINPRIINDMLRRIPELIDAEKNPEDIIDEICSIS